MNLNYEVSKEILQTGRTKNKIICVLEEFLKSGKEIAKVEYAKGEYTDSRSCYAALKHCINKFKYPIKVTTRDSNVYIYRLNPDERRETNVK